MSFGAWLRLGWWVDWSLLVEVVGMVGEGLEMPGFETMGHYL
jgi:hypothetical protein